MSRSEARSVAELVVDFLIARNVDRVFGLQGGHIQLIWDQLVQRRVRIIDVRDKAQRCTWPMLMRCSRAARRRVGDRRPGCDQLRHGHGECATGTRAGDTHRRLRPARPGRSGAAARRAAHGYPAAGNPALPHAARGR